ncbi:hypothetical protein FRC10_005008, partial [Ceratobasidium sp. 414]
MKKPVKRPLLQFDSESDDEPPRRTRHARDQGANDHSPPPKHPGRGPSVARERGIGKDSVTISAEAAHSLGKLLGVNPETATASAINDTIKSLSDHRTPQVDSSRRYSQVRGEASTPLPSLNKKGGGYHRDKLLALARPQPQSLERSTSGTDVGTSKHPHVDNRDDDVDMADPAPDAPRLPSFLERGLPSTSSTQHAVVNAFASQRELPHALQTTDRVRFGAGNTPVPQPRGHFFLFPQSAPRAPSSNHRAVTPELPAIPRKPHILVPGSPSLSPSPEPRGLQPASTQAHVDAPKPPPRQDYDTATEPETEPEPVLRLKPVITQTPRAGASKPPLRNNPDTATEPSSESEPVLIPRPQPKMHADSHRTSPFGDPPSRPGAKPLPPTPMPRHPQPTTTQARKRPACQDSDTATESEAELEPVRPKPMATQAPRLGASKPPPRKDPHPATESDSDADSEPVPMLRPKQKKRTDPHRADPPGDQSSRPRAMSPTQHHRHAPSRHRSGAVLSTGQDDPKSILEWLGDALRGDSGDDENSILDQTIELLQQHRRQHSNTHPSSSSRRQPTHSSSRNQPGPATNHHARRQELPDNLSDTGPHPAPHTDHSTSAGSGGDSAIDVTKTGLGRYPGTRGKAASHAIPKLLSTATRKGIYQEYDTYLKWARNAYHRVWAERYPHLRYKDPPLDLLRTIVLRISGLRTDVKKRIRELIIYLFEFVNPGSSVRLITANQRQFSRLYPNTFHCRDLKTDTDQFEHLVFIRAICVAFFWNQDSFAVRDHEKFKVLPLPAVAFVLTMMQDCLREWETGVFRARENDFKTQRDMFDAHLHSLHQYRKSAQVRLHRFQCKWFKKGMRNAG